MGVLMQRRDLMLGAAGLILSPSALLAEDSPFVGPWYGTLLSESYGQATRLRLELKPDGTAEMVDMDITGFPNKGRVTSQTSTDVTVGFVLGNAENPQVTFQGRAVGDRLEGTWTQGPFKLPFILNKGDPPGWSDWAIYTTPVAALSKARLEIYRRTFQIPALAAGVRKDGRTSVWSTGRRRADAEVPVNETDQWLIGSISKSMTATLVARLVEAGQVRWDDTIGDVLGGAVVAMRPPYGRATYRSLLTHRAGLIENLPADVLERFSFEALGPRSERLDYVRQVLAAPPVAAIEEKFSYSSAGYVTAAAMLEATTGRSWEALMRRHLFDPLGLASAGFGSPGHAGRIEQPFGHKLGLHGYEVVRAGGGLHDIPAVVGPAGGVHINLTDLLAYLAAHGQQQSPFLSAESWQTLHSPPPGGDYAMGWSVTPEGNLAHVGATALWLAQVMIDPRQGTCAAVATNVNGAFRAVNRSVREAAISA